MAVAPRLLALALAIGAVGCAANHSPNAAATAGQASALDPGQQAVDTGGDRQRLDELWQQRTTDSYGSDFTLGPGDVMEISVPLEQLQHREVRVSPRYTITLPLAGVVDVKGMTEQQLTDNLRERLSKYMYDPPISLFVSHYGSREVAVMGAVAKPDLYTLENGSDTLMAMISKAGGMTGDSAAKVIFVPGGDDGRGQFHFQGLTKVSDSRVSDSGPSRSSNGPVQNEGPIQSEHLGPIQPVTAATRPSVNPSAISPLAMTGLHPIVIWMNDPTMRNYLELPARPGDLLIIPAAGQVTVGGWVQNPGAFGISTGMTALSAISAAGGPLFSTTGEVLRTTTSGAQRSIIPFSISSIKKGEEPDVPVQSGDVVMVNRSVLGAGPYFVYTLFSKFGTGVAVPIP